MLFSSRTLTKYVYLFLLTHKQVKLPRKVVLFTFLLNYIDKYVICTSETKSHYVDFSNFFQHYELQKNAFAHVYNLGLNAKNATTAKIATHFD